MSIAQNFKFQNTSSFTNDFRSVAQPTGQLKNTAISWVISNIQIE